MHLVINILYTDNMSEKNAVWWWGNNHYQGTVSFGGVIFSDFTKFYYKF